MKPTVPTGSVVGIGPPGKPEEPEEPEGVPHSDEHLRRGCCRLRCVLWTMCRIVSSVVVVFLLMSTVTYCHYRFIDPLPDMPSTTEHDETLPSFRISQPDGTVYAFHGVAHGDETNRLVVVLHGGPGDDFSTVYALRALSELGYFVVFYDQRGSGLSERQDDAAKFTVDQFVQDLDDIITYFPDPKTGKRRDDVVLIGHSWGAMLATAYVARKKPTFVKKVIMAEPGLLDYETFLRFMEVTNGMAPSSFRAMDFVRLYLAFIRSFAIKGTDSHVRSDYMALEFATNVLDDDRHPLSGYFCEGRPFRVPDVRFGSFASSVMQGGVGPDFDLTPGIEDFQHEILFLTSECNTLIGTEYQERLARKFPLARVVTVPNAGHLMFDDNLEACLDFIVEYFKS